MQFGTVVFFILFAFLVFQLGMLITSLFFKNPYTKNHKPPVSVVIPAYNEEKNIVSCIESIINTQYEQLDIIIVDDGSTDGTIKQIHTLQKLYPNIILVKGKHKGKTDSLNLGIQHAKEEIVVNIDADTVVEREFITAIVRPFADKTVGAVSGMPHVRNATHVITWFQEVEYYYNNLIRYIFSKTFKTGIWLFGSVTAYRKEALEKVAHFSKDTLAEDMDIALAIQGAGYKTINVPDAIGYTVVPTSIYALFQQRRRWWVGGLQGLKKHKQLFTHQSNIAIKFVFVNQYWWTLYAFLSIPLIIYQVHFWWPGGIESILYLVRWFSLWGPVYVLYKIPEWGVNYTNIFGVLSGFISVTLIAYALKLYKARINFKTIIGIVFYFPYTLILAGIVIVSVLKNNKKYFIK